VVPDVDWGQPRLPFYDLARGGATVSALGTAPLDPFAHEAFLYASPGEHTERCAAFIEEGLDAGEDVLVAVPSSRLEALQPRFAAAGDRVRFEPMEVMGRNPAWIIPAWAEFALPHAVAGRPARGIGEPIWAERSPDELVECVRHESLLNLAFQEAAGFTLLCPYDTSSLLADVLETALHNHPTVHDHRGTGSSDRYLGDIPDSLGTALPAPPPDARFQRFDLTSLVALRDLARRAGIQAGLGHDRIEDLAVVTTEAATNSVRHAGGHGCIGLWREGPRVVVEVRDDGALEDPLAGRRRPDHAGHGGRGLWLMQQLADLVQHRTTPTGQVFRIHVGP
jgi:anti-sigma regulatory factor (Ser/Thr protein kinase)